LATSISKSVSLELERPKNGLEIIMETIAMFKLKVCVCVSIMSDHLEG
jgi:hypothetical protein